VPPARSAPNGAPKAVGLCPTASHGVSCAARDPCGPCAKLVSHVRLDCHHTVRRRRHAVLLWQVSIVPRPHALTLPSRIPLLLCCRWLVPRRRPPPAAQQQQRHTTHAGGVRLHCCCQRRLRAAARVGGPRGVTGAKPRPSAVFCGLSSKIVGYPSTPKACINAPELPSLEPS
jgi:hypothetical protein